MRAVIPRYMYPPSPRGLIAYQNDHYRTIFDNLDSIVVILSYSLAYVVITIDFCSSHIKEHLRLVLYRTMYTCAYNYITRGPTKTPIYLQ